jgi:hypothetical protein
MTANQLRNALLVLDTKRAVRVVTTGGAGNFAQFTGRIDATAPDMMKQFALLPVVSDTGRLSIIDINAIVAVEND